MPGTYLYFSCGYLITALVLTVGFEYPPVRLELRLWGFIIWSPHPLENSLARDWAASRSDIMAQIYGNHEISWNLEIDEFPPEITFPASISMKFHRNRCAARNVLVIGSAGTRALCHVYVHGVIIFCGVWRFRVWFVLLSVSILLVETAFLLDV